MRILRVNTEGEAKVISLNNSSWEENLDLAICHELGSLPAKPMIQNGVWPQCEYSSNTLLYLYAKEDLSSEKENIYCSSIIPDTELPSNILGPVVIVKYVRDDNSWGYHPKSMGKDEIKYLLNKIGVEKVENLYPHQDRKEGLWWKKEKLKEN